MIETPSLRSRVIVAGIAFIAVSTLTLDTFVFLSLRDQLEQSLDEVLTARAQVAQRIGEDNADPALLADELADAGIPAIVRTEDGQIEISQPTARRFDVIPPDTQERLSDVDRRVVELTSGLTVEVQVSRAGAEGTLRQLLLVEAVATAALLAIALIVLRRLAAVISRPVDRIVGVARRIADGATHDRIRPSDPGTELGRMAAAFDETFDALEAALEEARRAESASRSFLADAAHQLRTPMAGIRASAEELLRNPEGPDRERLLANLARESGRASRVVTALLRVARLERGEAMAEEPLDLVALAEEERERAEALAPHLTVALHGADQPCRLIGDRQALREAVGNLLDNARHFARTRIDLHLERSTGLVTLVIEDDGPGIPPDREERVFERFVSIDGEGAGLGLPIARGIARSHGGDLVVSGSRFRMMLPTAPVPRAATPLETMAGHNAPPPIPPDGV